MRLVLVAATVGVLAAGCMSGGPGGPEGAVKDAAKKTVDEESGKVSMTGAVEGNPADQGALEGTGAFAKDAGEMAITVKRGTNETTEIVYQGTVFYVQPPDATGLPPGKRWLTVDLAEFAPSAAADLSGFIQFVQSDPKRILGLVASGITDVKEDGSEEIRGVPTTKYTGTIDLTEAAESAGDLEDALKGALEGAEFTTLPVQVWVDDDGLVRRFAYSLPVAAERGGGTATVTVELYDFGANVEVEIPPEDETYNLGDVAAGQTTTGSR
jgi:LppX_LprAFG lipoprotein